MVSASALLSCAVSSRCGEKPNGHFTKCHALNLMWSLIHFVVCHRFSAQSEVINTKLVKFAQQIYHTQMVVMGRSSTGWMSRLMLRLIRHFTLPQTKLGPVRKAGPLGVGGCQGGQGRWLLCLFWGAVGAHRPPVQTQDPHGKFPNIQIRFAWFIPEASVLRKLADSRHEGTVNQE